MRLHRRSWSGAALIALLAGCSSTVLGVDAGVVDAGDAGVDTGPATGCDCPRGRCAVGERWTAPDGCNTCTCGAGGLAACTLLGCLPPDAGPVVGECSAPRDCAANEVCEFEQGCAITRGRCASNTCLNLPVVLRYCGCDGATIEGNACRPARPWRSMGPCASAPDGG